MFSRSQNKQVYLMRTVEDVCIVWTLLLLCLVDPTSSLLTAEVTSCGGDDVTIVLRGYNSSIYRGRPYVKGYEHIKDCIRLLTYDPVSHTHRLQFRMDYTDVRFDRAGVSVHHPTTSICATVHKMRSFRAGSFQTTVVLPKSTGVELDGDLAVGVHCSWDHDVSLGHHGSAVVSQIQELHRKENSVVDIDVMTSSKLETRVIRLGEQVTVQVVMSALSVMWDEASIWSVDAVSKLQHRHRRRHLVQDGCIVKGADSSVLNLSMNRSHQTGPRLTFNAFRFLTDPVLQLEVMVHLCKAESEHCHPECTGKNKTPKPSPRLTVMPETQAYIEPTEYEEVSTSVYLLVPYSHISRGKCDTLTDVTVLSDVLVVLTTEDVTTLTVILFFILGSLILSASTVIAYHVILHRRRHSASVNLWKVVLRPPKTPSGLDSTGSESPRGEGSWMKNRLITPPPTFAHSLKFTSTISPLGNHSPSTIDGKHFCAK